MNWVFVVSMSCAFVGFWLYMYEVIQGNIGRYTKWSELKENQWTAVILTLGGGAGLLISVIAAALSRNT